LVEAEKSTLALTAWAKRTGANLLAVAMGGCWGWKGRTGKVENSRGERVDEKGPIADLDCLNGRKVFVLLDANVATNPKVQRRVLRSSGNSSVENRKCSCAIFQQSMVSTDLTTILVRAATKQWRGSLPTPRTAEPQWRTMTMAMVASRSMIGAWRTSVHRTRSPRATGTHRSQGCWNLGQRGFTFSVRRFGGEE